MAPLSGAFFVSGAAARAGCQARLLYIHTVSGATKWQARWAKTARASSASSMAASRGAGRTPSAFVTSAWSSDRRSTAAPTSSALTIQWKREWRGSGSGAVVRAERRGKLADKRFESFAKGLCPDSVWSGCGPDTSAATAARPGDSHSPPHPQRCGGFFSLSRVGSGCAKVI